MFKYTTLAVLFTSYAGSAAMLVSKNWIVWQALLGAIPMSLVLTAFIMAVVSVMWVAGKVYDRVSKMSDWINQK